MKRLKVLLVALVLSLPLIAVQQSQALAASPTYSFTHGNNYCGLTSSDNFARLRVNIHLDADHDQVVNSAHIWAGGFNDGCGQGLERCVALENLAAEGRLRIWGINPNNGAEDLILDRSPNLTHSGNCDYLSGTTQDFNTGRHKVLIEWSYTLHGLNINRSGYLQIWRTYVPSDVDPDNEQWGCKGGDTGPDGICYTQGPI
jgi:hypothetical protein